MMSGVEHISKVEDIMTPRSLFICVDERESQVAATVAEENNFDVVPLLCRGEIRKYWSQESCKTLPITKRHRVPHNAAIHDVASRLRDHPVQFVEYRSQIVGLVDISDLNKPLARLAWLRPMLELEQGLLGCVQAERFSDEAILDALSLAATYVRKRRHKAHQENLDLPLLNFANFGDLLKTAVRLGVVKMEGEEVERLTALRNCLAHAGRELIKKRSDTGELAWATSICRRSFKFMAASGKKRG